MTQRRLAYLSLEAPREGQAAFTHVREITEGLRRQGWTVDLIAPSHSWAARRPGALVRLLYHLPLQIGLLLRIRRYHVIYVRAHPFAFPTALFASLLSRPIVHEVNGTYDDIHVAYPRLRPLRALFGGMQRWQYRHADKLVAVTEGLGQWLQDEFGAAAEDVAIISNGANTDVFHPDAATDLQLPENYAVFAGGLTAWHGIPTILAAKAEAAWPADLSLVIVGDGPERPRVTVTAASDPSIVYLGHQRYLEVPGIIAAARIGLVPIGDPGGRSSAGGVAPIKLFEKLACGVPVIATNLPPQRDIVRENDCGLVIEVDDSAALARAVAKLASSPEEAAAMGRRGAAFIRQGHSWAHRTAATSALLEKLL